MSIISRLRNSKILNWSFPGANKPAPKPKQNGPSGPKGSVSDKIQPVPESRSLGELVAEMNTDYQIKFCNYVLAANVAAVNVSISIDNGDGPKSEAIQEKLQKLWEKTIAAMMDSVGFGRVAFEKGWDFDEKKQITYVKKLEAMEFCDSRLKLTEDHKFDGFEVRISENPEKWEKVKQPDAWWLAIGATAKNPHGRSHYVGAVEKAWRIKTQNMENRNMFIRRFAIRGGTARGPEYEVDERTGLIYDCAERMAEATENFYTGGNLFLSNEPHPDPRMADAGHFKWEFNEAIAIADPGPIQEMVDDDDVAVTRAFGIPEKAAIEGDGVGSYSQLSEQILTLFALVDWIMGQWAASFQEYVVLPTRIANYGTGPGPDFTLNAVKLTNRPDSFVVSLLTALAANPQFTSILLGGGIDLRDVLEKVGLPVTADLEAVAKQVAAQLAATTGAIKGGPGAVPGADPTATEPGGVPGEFANTSTLQLNRNMKATHTILDKFMAGSTAAVTQTMLEAIGWTPERAAALIKDASDGSVDDPEVAGGVTMANRVLRRQQKMIRNFLAGVKKKSPPK